MEQAGYQPVTAFVLPENCWTTQYYEPQLMVQQQFLTKYKGNDLAVAFIQNERREKELFDRFKAYYGYVFYIGIKRH
jgi:hypothetical protein